MGEIGEGPMPAGWRRAGTEGSVTASVVGYRLVGESSKAGKEARQ